MNSALSSDTITAIATAPGKAGISVIRISGPDSLRIADIVFSCNPPRPTWRPHGSFVRGLVRDTRPDRKDDEIIDEALLLVFRAPRSYTAEDTAEIQCHGGRITAARILETVCNAGARPAEPGEFTKRAFLNGRIDLLQAEAVADLINARTSPAADSALKQLRGHLTDSAGTLYDDALSVAGELSAMLDFPDETLPVQPLPEIRLRVNRIVRDIEKLLETHSRGRILREGALVAITGEPNAGKSSLLNILLEEPRAIVDSAPGTTRDTIEEEIEIAGYPVRLVDTAGLRNTGEYAEQEGVTRAKKAAETADVVIFMMDSSKPIGKVSAEFLAETVPEKTIAVLNKSDLPSRIKIEEISPINAITCSCMLKEGINNLKQQLVNNLNITSNETSATHISERHYQLLQYALNEMNNAYDILTADREDACLLAVSAMRPALEALGNLTGKVYTQELLDNIFDRFCIGK